MATIKQKVAFKEVVKGSTIVSAMKKANYAPTTASRTNKLTRTKGWQELMETFISDKELARVHKEGLSATTFFSEGLGKGVTVLVEKPDYSVRHKYLESGYKIKGKIPKEPQQENPTSNTFIQINIHPPHEQSIGHQANSEAIPSVASSTES